MDTNDFAEFFHPDIVKHENYVNEDQLNMQNPVLIFNDNQRERAKELWNLT